MKEVSIIIIIKLFTVGVYIVMKLIDIIIAPRGIVSVFVMYLMVYVVYVTE